jgi:voltage-gated potassium channel
MRASWWLEPRGIATALILGILAGGTLGYRLIEGWTLWDSLYMTVITVTTVGYREVHPMSRVGEAFTVLLLLGGVGTFFYVLSLAVAGLVQGGLASRWEAQRRDRMIDELSNHFIVCGFGRMGRIIVDEFRKERVPFLVIDRDPDLVHQVIESGALGLAADASTEEVLIKSGLPRAKALIAAAGTDAENVYIILTARLLRPDLYIIGRAETEDAIRKLKRAGADRVLAPYQVGAQQIAQAALRPAVLDFVQLATGVEGLELGVEQVQLAADSALCGQSLLAANLRQRFGVVVVGIRRATGHMEFNPPPDALMAAEDQLVVMGSFDSLKRLETVAQGQATSA